MADSPFSSEGLWGVSNQHENLKIDFNVVILKYYLAYNKCMFEQNTISNFHIHLVRGRSGRETKLLNS